MREADSDKDPEKIRQRIRDINRILKQLLPGFHGKKIEELQAEKKQLLQALRRSRAAETKRAAPNKEALSRSARRRLRQELTGIEEELIHLESEVRNAQTQRKMKALRERKAAIVSRFELAKMFASGSGTRKKQETLPDNAKARKKQKKRLEERAITERKLEKVNNELKAMRGEIQNEEVRKRIEVLRQRKMFLEYKLHEGVMQTPQYDMWMYWYKGPGKVRFRTGRQD